MLRVGIADDEQIVRDMMKLMFTKFDLPINLVGEYTNGRELIDGFERTKHDLQFVDIRMPDLDGIEALKVLKDKQVNCKFVIVSAYNDFKLMQKVIRLGIVDYLLKPINPDEVYSVLNDTIKKDLRTGDDGMSAIVNMARQYIQNNYQNSISLNKVAEQVAVSPSYLSQIFSREAGLPFNHYLKKIRLQMAESLLTETTEPIKNISRLVGYKDESYFCRLFKKEKSVSPTIYRKLRSR